MGYSTYFDLTVHDLKMNKLEDEVEMSVISKFREVSERASYAFDESGCCQVDVNWYNYEEELQEFSKQFPEYIFELHGDGEDSTDNWKLYVLNGVCQAAHGEIIWPEFDEEYFKSKGVLDKSSRVAINFSNK